MADYQVIARKFRPQTFREVVAQEAIVTTLKNAIKFNRLAQAYLFCGSRGTGKTTLARLFAKALNCQNPGPDFEPCNQCSSCREIALGTSIDVLEIDGASHRGIEDIRQINENVGYASASTYKIYIIDEVHMLTKEAFNALLKTLEEPPPKVKFFFATTEPHKILPTILSRCQRFNLSRIPPEKIVVKLESISKQLGVEIEQEALCLLAKQAEGGLRDAESLLDQILAFETGRITASTVNTILGLMPKDSYFELDRAGKEGNFSKAFEIAHQVFSQGKDLIHFIEGLTEHYRTILLTKIGGKENLLFLSPQEKEQYHSIASLFNQEQCLHLIDYLIQAQQQLRFNTSNKIALEAVLLHVIRSHFRVPIDVLVQRLAELEEVIGGKESIPVQKIEKKEVPPVHKDPVSTPTPTPKPAEKVIYPVSPSPTTPSQVSSISIDPTPTPADFGIKKAPAKTTPTPTKQIETVTPTYSQTPKNDTEINLKKPGHYYDTLLHFTAVELEGKVQKIKNLT